MKRLIIYYSYGGNTKKIAEMIQKSVGCDMEEIKTVQPYTGDYMAVVDQGKQEVDSSYMPEIQPLSVNIAEYDQIILGSPIWWYTFAPAVKTFLSQYDLSGKEVVPFSTNGGWPGHFLKDVANACKDANVKEGMEIHFDENRMVTDEREVARWIQKVLN